MTTFGIEVNPASREQKTGTEWYTVKLVEAMQKQVRPGDEVRLYSRENLKWPFKRLWTQLRLSWEMLRRPPDVLFVPAHAVPRVHPKKTVTTVHDLGFKRFPHLYESKARRYLEATTKFAVKKCARIITPSEFTKHELVELYHADPDKIVVTPLAPIMSPLTTNQLPLSHTFLTMSRIESKKNIAALIRAFEIFKERRGVGDPFELYLAGKPGFGYGAIKQLIDRSPARASIKELGFVTDEQARNLFASAYAYVYPSWYEGFGISAVDAMQFGTPIIASNIPALHEAAGEAAVYFDPNSPQELARHMSELADNPTLRNELAQKSLVQVAQFSWEKTAEQTWGVLRSLT